MMTWLRKYNKHFLLVTFAFFLLGGVLFTGFDGFSRSPFSAVLVVNGEKIPYKRFESLLTRHLQQQGGAMNPEKVSSLKASALQELVQETALLQEADRYGIRATDAELASYLQNVPAFQRDGRFDQNLYLSYVTQGLRVSPAVFEEEQRRGLRRQKLLMLLSSSIRVSESEARQFLARLPAEERRELEKDPQKLKSAAAQEQGNAALQAWLQQLNSRLKTENHLDRWERQEG